MRWRTRTRLARPTARRLLMTLEQLGYARLSNGAYSLTTKTLELGTSYVAAQGLWDIARPHLVAARVANRRVELDVATRWQRHRVHGAGASAQDHRHLGADRDAIPGDGHLDGSGAARRPDAVGTRRRAGQTVGIGRDPPRRALPVRARRVAGGDPPSGAGRSRTSCCRWESVRSPLRSATAPDERRRR